MGPSHSKQRVRARRWFSLLAEVEIQSVMRCLGLKDLLCFARCSQQLLTAAASDFACANTLLHTVTPQANLDSIRGRVLGHCPLAVQWLNDARRECTSDV